KVCRMSERSGLLDVTDLGTGQKYSIPLHALARPAPKPPAPEFAPPTLSANITPPVLLPPEPAAPILASRWFARKPEPSGITQTAAVVPVDPPPVPRMMVPARPPFAVTPPSAPPADPLNAVSSSAPSVLPPATFAPVPVAGP
ncbi:MAG: hypothetical protein ACRC7O_09535, partial [Fimbriiglobus sp.]